MKNLVKIHLTEQTIMEINELRIDSIRNRCEKNIEQIIQFAVHELFKRFHDKSENVKIPETHNDVDYEQKTNCIMFRGEEYWGVKQIRDYVQKNYCTINTYFIYKAFESGNLQYVSLSGKHIAKVADVKNFLEKYFDSLQNKKRISTQKKTKIKREHTEEELEAMRARAAHARLSIGKSKQNVAATEALLS